LKIKFTNLIFFSDEHIFTENFEKLSICFF